MNTLLTAVIALVTVAWGWDVVFAGGAPASITAWSVRQETLHLTGLWSFSLMSLAMLLATRPAWLERPLGGMDRIYRTHKWAGILAIGLAALHWLVEMSDDVIKALFGRTGRLPKEHAGGLIEALRDLAEEFGEWAIYALLVMLALTLWKRFPFNIWRHLHRVMPLLYLMLALHAAFLVPLAYWGHPVGALLALFIAAGSAASGLALAGRIGRRRQTGGTVEAVHEAAAGITEVNCRLDAAWRGHRAGQFAFVTFDRAEGAHPFTIASADRGDGRVTFQIKALGDYTRSLAARLRAGQPLRIEGPYGRFQLPTASARKEQIWIAGGIGVTPFLAWLESLQARPEEAPAADLHYCTRQRDDDPFVARLETLCASLPTIRLRVYSSDRKERLTADELRRHGGSKRPEIWFCGPRALGDALRAGLRQGGMRVASFHQEAFEMR
jgi:predicted ferric reductase